MSVRWRSEIGRSALPIAANCAARTVRADIEPIARITQETGVPIEACTFIGSSPIRQYAEDWTLDRMLAATEDAVRFAVGEGLSVMYVTEDTTRARPETLKRLYTLAIECGARRICLADTVGHATPAGVRGLVRFIREEVIAPAGGR
jgi:isopropylmalate/homocitrate/citramalate synthase